jgi:hypothetical protein
MHTSSIYILEVGRAVEEYGRLRKSVLVDVTLELELRSLRLQGSILLIVWSGASAVCQHFLFWEVSES